MSLLRIAGALAVLASCIGGGLYFSERIKSRRDFLSELLRLLNNLEIRIRFSGDDLGTLLRLSAPEKLRELFEDGLWEDFVARIPRGFALRAEDHVLLRDFGSILGATDTEGQLRHIKMYLGLFEERYNNSVEEYKIKGRLYRILGFALGCALALLIL